MCAWEKCHLQNKVLLFLPIGIEMFPFKERKDHVFVANLGYGGINDRRQLGAIARAFRAIKDPDARLIINSQHHLPGGVLVEDQRVTLNLKNYPTPTDIYREGDISILPIAYGGYERSILESMASGMPTLTMNADPMNLFQHDSDFLIDPARVYRFSDQYVVNTDYNEVAVETLKAKMEWLLTIDTPLYSQRARAQAEAQSWESREIDYKRVWLTTLVA
jgi:glycosyltransferase involved in cell wall biosynthesis